MKITSSQREVRVSEGSSYRESAVALKYQKPVSLQEGPKVRANFQINFLNYLGTCSTVFFKVLLNC